MRFEDTAATAFALARSLTPLQPLTGAARALGSCFFGWIGDTAAAGAGAALVSAEPGFVMNHSNHVGPQDSSNLCSMRTSKPLLRKKLTCKISSGHHRGHDAGDEDAMMSSHGNTHSSRRLRRDTHRRALQRLVLVLDDTRAKTLALPHGIDAKHGEITPLAGATREAAFDTGRRRRHELARSALVRGATCMHARMHSCTHLPVNEGLAALANHAERGAKDNLVVTSGGSVSVRSNLAGGDHGTTRRQ